MPDSQRLAARHYGHTNVGDAVLDALRNSGKDISSLTPEDLAPVDAFHVRGRLATEALAAACTLGPEHHVLDVGSGLGGSARYLAHRFGCRVTGLDLTPEYVDAAQRLTGALAKRFDVRERVDFRVGSALEMPFDDGQFDLAWSEHVQMNIADKPRLYAEVLRVIRPGGRFAFHDLLQGTAGECLFPVPWASEGSFSHLIDPEDFRALLGSVGFQIERWEDTTAISLDWFRKRAQSGRKDGPPTLGFQQLIGRVAPEALRNMLRNLEEGRIAVVQGVAAKPA